MIGICSKAQMACTKGEVLGQSPLFPTEASEPAKISSFHAHMGTHAHKNTYTHTERASVIETRARGFDKWLDPEGM